MKNSFRVAGAIVGTIIGAGYASGQEVLQFFSSSGWLGTVGAIITIGLYPLICYYVVLLGQKNRSYSHKNVIYQICGKYLGFVVDILLAFFYFGLGVTMVAGSGALFAQQFEINPVIGYMILTTFVILTLILNIRTIVTVLSWITPYAFVLFVILAIYSISISSLETSELDSIAMNQLSASPNWLLSAILHVSFNIAVGFAMMVVIGGTEKDKKATRRGAIIGGIILGLIALIVHLAVYLNIDMLQDAEMPMLILATDISPIVGLLMAIALLGMIFSSTVPYLYTFTARFFQADTRRFNIAAIFVGITAFSLGFVGFSDLVNTVYPLMGYLGFVLIGALIVQLFRSRRQKINTAGSKEEV
ncbi:hypothetical protein HUG15_02920 [Salicibibacter cibarius]|uniref:Membrane protein YkvI n=1 Tax=Salicibibacter cibarius TaxID=2743000 RepID=A0A7T7CA93_9BACI|nr:hypothetical protein [Salicibibacter cibarius]QQK74654.1 hypothetical protein HUG15_02920 [Salicibibacter cibarius]